MEPASARDYAWIHDAPLFVAACLTVVTGMTADDVLAGAYGLAVGHMVQALIS